MATLIDKINKFESMNEQTVKTFNKTFVGDELPEIYPPKDEVEIGEISGPVNVRLLQVGTEIIKHEFEAENIEYIKGGISQLETSNRLGAIQTNASLENEVLEEKELELDPFEYKLLQYLRGSRSPFHTVDEIAFRIRKSRRGVYDALKRMKEKDIIHEELLPNVRKIIITEEWA